MFDSIPASQSIPDSDAARTALTVLTDSRRAHIWSDLADRAVWPIEKFTSTGRADANTLFAEERLLEEGHACLTLVHRIADTRAVSADEIDTWRLQSTTTARHPLVHRCTNALPCLTGTGARGAGQAEGRALGAIRGVDGHAAS
ncbi:MAG: hypothetical protein IT335_15300 [Thermomicrobiales bacterium]|nr:hypothetical protein [Thermomicrobiales bacterium]